MPVYRTCFETGYSNAAPDAALAKQKSASFLLNGTSAQTAAELLVPFIASSVRHFV